MINLKAVAKPPHTPGPCLIYPEEWNAEKRQAYKRLIAAAPDLLELLKTCPIGEPTSESDEWLEDVKKAIAKAEGK